MPAKQTLALDQGTHATRATVYDHYGQPLASARRPVSLTTHGGVRAEQSGAEILASVEAVVRSVLADPAVEPHRLGAAGLATQRSSVVAWDRLSGRPLSPVINWQDRRAATDTQALSARANEIAERTGLRLSPHYGASKMRWLLESDDAPGTARDTDRLIVGPLAAFLVFRLLTDRPAVVDHANASRTLLWNLATGDWDPSLLALFDIPREVLPDCRPIRDDYGVLTDVGVPLSAVNGDQTAALYAQGEPASDTLMVNIGTGAFVLRRVADPANRPNGSLAGIACSGLGDPHFHLEGTVNGAGAALSWAERRFAIADLEAGLSIALERDRAPPVFVNTVSGLGSPWWQTGAAPHFLGEPVDDADRLVAILESIVFLLQANIDLLNRRPSSPVRRIRVSGGLAQLDGLCRRLADLSGLRTERPEQREATSRGIAWLAAGCPDDWVHDPVGVFEPRRDAALEARYRRFLEAVQATTDAASP